MSTNYRDFELTVEQRLWDSHLQRGEVHALYMGILGAMTAALAFVADMDGTLVHYEAVEAQADIVKLPASSSGKIGLVSKTTLRLLDDVAATGVIVACASGMRVATMHKRQAHFPAVKYWICENGGRIFERTAAVGGDGASAGAGMIELLDWRRIGDDDKESKEALEQFKMACRAHEGFGRDFVLDDQGYFTMARIKAKSSHRNKAATLAQVAALVPPCLTTTMNLGYLDVCYPHTGKLAATRWLLERLLCGSDTVTNTVGEYWYMGDDDNDVEVGRASQRLFVTRPCSAAMQALVESGVVDVRVAPVEGTGGTNALLHQVLALVLAHRKGSF